MKRNFIYIICSIAFSSLLFTRCNKKASEIEQIKEIQFANLDSLQSAVQALREAVNKSQNQEVLQEKFKKARIAYKRIEFLTELYHPTTAKSINGPAIDEVEPDAADVVIPAEGFQVIEELLFPEYLQEKKAELIHQVDLLLSNIERLAKVTQTTTYTDSHIFDALKLELFRVITLGISGFDSPIAQNSIAEAKAVIAAEKQIFELYSDRFDNKAKEHYNKALQTFDAAISYLNHHVDFNDFDRFTFIKEYVNPITTALTKAQNAARIPVFNELRALRADAETIFDSQAFNANYYAASSEEHLNETRVTLGKVLFYDPILSGNMQRSCASCHNPDKAFTDGRQKSIAFDFKGQVNRNAPTLMNAGLQKSLFHDSRVAYLEDQATDVLKSQSEMHGSMEEASERLRNSKEYLEMFEKAFPKKKANPISEQSIKIALASFTRSLNSFNSRFDQHIRGEKKSLTPSEVKGFNIFMGKAKCGTCHFMPLFNGTVPPYFSISESEVIGVPAKNDTSHALVDPDVGKYSLYKIEKHKFAFKTPTIRNIELTGPYMHNGIFNNLEEVVDFYDRGGGVGIGINLPNQTLPEDKLNLTDLEKEQLVAFMKALTDTVGYTAKPTILPVFNNVNWNNRAIGGKY